MKLKILTVTVAVTPTGYTQISGGSVGCEVIAEVWAVAEDGHLWTCQPGEASWTRVKLPSLEIET